MSKNLFYRKNALSSCFGVTRSGTRTAGAAPRTPPDFLFIPPKRKSAKKTAATAWSIAVSQVHLGGGRWELENRSSLRGQETGGPVLMGPPVVFVGLAYGRYGPLERNGRQDLRCVPHPGPQSDRPRPPDGSGSWTACAAESPLDEHQRLQPHSLARAQALSFISFFGPSKESDPAAGRDRRS